MFDITSRHSTQERLRQGLHLSEMLIGHEKFQKISTKQNWNRHTEETVRTEFQSEVSSVSSVSVSAAGR